MIFLRNKESFLKYYEVIKYGQVSVEKKMLKFTDEIKCTKYITKLFCSVITDKKLAMENVNISK